MEQKPNISNTNPTSLDNQRIPEASSPTSYNNPEQNTNHKSNNGLKAFAAIACVLAICGIGFGVWGIISSNSTKSSLASKDSEINSLKSSIEELKNRITEMEAQSTESHSDSAQNNQSSQNQNQTPTQTPTQPSTQTPTTSDKGLITKIQNGTFILEDSNGTVIAQDNSKNVTEIISCDSGTANSSTPLKCTAKTADGKTAWFMYNYDNKELKSGYSSNN